MKRLSSALIITLVLLGLGVGGCSYIKSQDPAKQASLIHCLAELSYCEYAWANNTDPLDMGLEVCREKLVECNNRPPKVEPVEPPPTQPPTDPTPPPPVTNPTPPPVQPQQCVQCADGGNGCLWKPVSERTGGPVMLTDSSYQGLSVTVSPGVPFQMVIIRDCCTHNGGRNHLYFSQKMSGYQEFRFSDGRCIKVRDASVRED